MMSFFQRRGCLMILMAWFIVSIGWSQVVINEVDYDQPGLDDREYVELLNRGQEPVDLAAGNYVLWLVDQNGSIYRRFPLTGVIEPKGYYVIGAATVPGVNQVVTPATNLIQNGPNDAVALVIQETAGGPFQWMDSLAYQGPNPLVTQEGFTTQFDSNSVEGSLVRYPDGKDTDDNQADFRFDTKYNPSPASPNTPLFQNPEELTVYFIDVGQGDATLIVSPSGRTILIDGGDNNRGNSIIVPLLQDLGVDGYWKTLDYMAATHYHGDHIGGLNEVAAVIPPLVAYDRGGDPDSVTVPFMNYVNSISSVRRQATPGEIVDLGDDAYIQFLSVGDNLSEGADPIGNQLYPSGKAPIRSRDRENELSLTMKLTYKGFQLLVAGDLTGGGLGTDDIESYVATAVGNVDAYQVNHHSSLSSTNQAFAEVLRPLVSVIPVGNNNPYGHPTQPVIDRLRSVGSKVYQTQTGSGGMGDYVAEGTIVLRTDGITYFDVAGGNLTPATYPLDAPVFIDEGQVLINEFRVNATRTGTQYVELFGMPGLSLEGCSLWGISATEELEYKLVSLDGQRIPESGYFVVANAGIANLNMLDPGMIPWASGPDTFELRQNGRVIDRVGYGSGGQGQYYEGSGPAPDDPPGDDSVGRDRYSTQTRDNAKDFGVQIATPGLPNRTHADYAGLLITEVIAAPTSDEFVEIANITGVPIYIGGMVLTDSDRSNNEGAIRFPADLVIQPYEVIGILLGARSDSPPSASFQSAIKPGTRLFSQFAGVTVPGFAVTPMEAISLAEGGTTGTVFLANAGDNVGLFHSTVVFVRDFGPHDWSLCIDGMNYGNTVLMPVGPSLEDVASAPAPPTGRSLHRVSPLDRNNSSLDFAVGNYSPGILPFSLSVNQWRIY